jgi:dipeptidyl aminopeptidase/acylaminoacyl peptidase
MHITQVTIPCRGYTIAADWYDSGLANGKLLLAIVGYGSTKARNAEFITDILIEAGLSGLVLDLSGHGESPYQLDDTKPAQHLLEVTAAFDWLRDKHRHAHISVVGTSYGGYMAAWLTRFRDFDKLVLRTPALYKPADFYTNHSSIPKADELLLYRKNTKLIKSNPLFLQESVFKGPTLLVVHSQDEDIPAETSEIYKDTFAAETYTAKDFRHSYRDPHNPPDGLESYKVAIAAWLDE